MLTRDQILGASLAWEDISVPEFGGEVRVMELTLGERFQFLAIAARESDQAKIQATLVALAAADEDGKKLFTLDDVPMLAKASGAGIARLFTAAQRLAGLTRPPEETRKN